MGKVPGGHSDLDPESPSNDCGPLWIAVAALTLHGM